MNINFTKITLHNFGSYSHAEIDLSNKGFCLVSGRNNYKKDNALSNGSGKSFLWSGICFALTGETISGLSKNLKNLGNDEPDAYVTLEFSVDSDEYKVTRIIGPKTDMKVYKNDEDVSGKGIRESEKRLGELLPDLTRDLITTMIILGQGMPYKFSSFSPSGRKDLLEQLTKSEYMIEDVKERVKGRQAEINSKIREQEDALMLNNAELNQARRTLTDASLTLSSTIKPDFDSKISELEIEINKNQSEIDNYQNIEKPTLDESENKINSDLSAHNVKLNEDLSALNESFTTVTVGLVAEKTDIESQIRNLAKEITRIKSIKDVCPTCGQKLIGVEKPDPAPLIKEEEDLKIKLSEITAQLEDKKAKLENYRKEITSAHDSQTKSLQEQLRDIRSRRSSKESEISALYSKLSRLNSDLTALKKDRDSWDLKISNTKKIIDDCQAKISSAESAIELMTAALEDLKEHLAVVNKIETLIKRDFRGYLLTNIIAYIDKKAKDYCDVVFKTRDLNVYLDGNALDISYCGKMFDNLSGGEKQRVDLILQFALRDMLSVYLDITSNIIVLDEITDFLDKTSCGAIMKLIETELGSTESVFIISHHAEELEIPVDSEIKIVKNEDGISEVM